MIETPQTTNPTPEEPTATPPRFPCTIRKLLQIGHSHAVSIPTSWVRANVEPGSHYVILDDTKPGQLTFRPLNPLENRRNDN